MSTEQESSADNASEFKTDNPIPGIIPVNETDSSIKTTESHPHEITSKEELQQDLPLTQLAIDDPNRPLKPQVDETKKHEEDKEVLANASVKPTEQISPNTVIIDQDKINTEEILKKLVEEFKPYFYLHPQEQYLPCSIEFYLLHSELYYDDTLIASEGKVTEELIGNIKLLEEARASAFNDTTNIVDNQTDEKKPDSEKQIMTISKYLNSPQSKSNPHKYKATPPLSNKDKGRKYNLRLNPAYRGGFEKDKINLAPLYARVRDCKDENYYEITYITHYAFNGSYKILWMDVGAHDCDFEHVTVRVSKTRSLLCVWFGSHGYRDGYWRNYKDCKIADKTHVQCFVANHGHGLYSTPGKQGRIWGFANDNGPSSIETGIEWKSDDVILLQPPTRPSYPAWTSYDGNWCIDGISSPQNQQWWICEPKTNNTKARRIFFGDIPFSKNWCLDSFNPAEVPK